MTDVTLICPTCNTYLTMKLETNTHRLRILLDDGRKLTLLQIQQQLKVSERQARRILQQLQHAGVTLRQEWQGRYKVFYLDENDQRTQLPDLHFSQAELRSLTVAVKASQAMLAGTPHAKPLREVFEKLLEQVNPVAYIFDVDEQLKEWQFEDGATDRIAIENFQKIESAMAERCSVRIDYVTASSQQSSRRRKIDPYFFAKRGRSWLVVAYCHQKQAMRNFSMMRISNLEVCDPFRESAYFSIPEDFVSEDYFRGAFGAINSDTCYELRLLVEPDKALYFQDRSYHPTQLIEETRSDGRLVVSYELEGFEEMRSFCQGWGVGVTVLDPTELRERLWQEAKTLVERYCPADASA